MITGKGLGMTSLIIWDIHGGRQFFNVTVRPNVGLIGDNLDAIRRELRTELPGEAIKVSYSNNSVFLRGTVNDLTSSARAVQIASTGGKVVNLLDVSVPKSDPQILLKVRFVSVDRNKALTLGVNLFNLGLGNALGGVSTGQFTPPTVSSGSSSSSSGGVTGNGGLSIVQPGRKHLCLLPRAERGRRHSCLGREGRGGGAGGAEPDGNRRQGSQLPRGRIVPVSSGVRHIRWDGRGQHRVQGLRHPLELYSHDHSAGHDPAAGGAGSERTGLCQRSGDLGLSKCRASPRKRSIPKSS